MRYNREDGFTLIELLLVIAILAVAISLTGFGLGSLYSSNAKSYTSKLMAQIRTVQNRELGSRDKNFMLIISKSDGRYNVITLMDDKEIDRINFPSNLIIEKYVGDGYVPFDQLSVEACTLTFDASSGAVTSSGYGRYRVALVGSENEHTFEVIKENGRVVNDEG